MKSLIGLALVGAASLTYAQTLPDCRQPNLPVGSACEFTGTNLGKQTYIGDISLPPSEHVHMTEPFQLIRPVPSPVAHPDWRPQAGALFTVQTETLGYKSWVSSGFKLFASKQWSDWRGLDARFTAVEFALGSIGYAPGNNHTAAFTIGPRVQHSFGIFTPYAAAEFGPIHQYYWGLSESGLFGAKVRVSNHLSVIPADVEYRWASLQDSTRYANPRRGRIELSAGLSYSFGN